MVVAGIICGIVSGAIAWEKHRSVFGWLVFGFFFSGLGLVAISVIPKNAKTCPKCGELSTYGTGTCEYCGYVFYVPKDKPDRPKEFITDEE